MKTEVAGMEINWTLYVLATRLSQSDVRVLSGRSLSVQISQIWNKAASVCHAGTERNPDVADVVFRSHNPHDGDVEPHGEEQREAYRTEHEDPELKHKTKPKNLKLNLSMC